MRPTVPFPGNGTTTPLGIGLATLMREPSPRAQQRLLDAAHDAGIRHFDVAPSYGLGAAERVLGKFLRRRAAGVTIATKVGIRARGNAALMRIVQRPARALLRRFPALRGRTTHAVGGVVHAPPDFSLANASRSLEDSLRALRIEHLDLLLLHEARPSNLSGGEVIDWLQEQKRRGRVGAIGVATSPESATAIVNAYPRVFDVVQVPANVFAPASDLIESAVVPLTITHSVLAAPLERIAERAAADAAWFAAFSSEVGRDLSARGELARLLLATALEANERGIVILGASRESHIRAATAAVGTYDRSRMHAAVKFLRDSFPARSS